MTTSSDDTRYGGYYVAQIFKKHDIEHVFALTGGHIAPILIACEKLGIQVVDVRHEVTTVFAADAYSRLSNKVGVAIVTAGPGITNTVTAVKNAQMAQSPVIIIGGATPKIRKGKGALQDIDQIAVMKSLVKWHVTLESYKDIAKVAEAFYRAREGVPGPVFIEIPIDLLWPIEMVRGQFGSSKQKLGKGPFGKFIKYYISSYEKKTFTGSEDFVVPEPIPFVKKQINQSDVQKIATAVNMAKKPVMLIGSQAIEYRNVQDVVAAVERMQIPVYLSGMARGLLGKDNSLQYRHKRTNALKEADVVILVGVPIDFRLGYGASINKHCQLISVNLSKHDLTTNRKANIRIQNSPSEFLIELARHVVNVRNNCKEWIETLDTREQARNAEIVEQSKEQMERINPLAMAMELEKFLDDNSILIGDGGDIIATISYIVQPRTPLSWLDPGPFGTLGVGAGFALASKILNPDKDVYLIYGDGSVGYSLIEWDTFKRHGISIIGIIGNDSSWNQVARDQVEVFKTSVGTELGDRYYEKAVEGFGNIGLLVKNQSELSATFQNALAFSKTNQSVLVNIIIGRSDFRKGSISM